MPLGGSVLFVLVVGVLGVLATPTEGLAASVGHLDVESFEADVEITPDGDLLVTETITVEFASSGHGILRVLPLRLPTEGRDWRRHRVEDVEVATDPGTPGEFSLSEGLRDLTVRIGGPEWGTVSGRHTYTISYRYVGALDSLEEHDELWWNVTGDRWDADIAYAQARVSAPVELLEAHCHEGSAATEIPCANTQVDGTAATFESGSLAPGQQLDVVVALPSGAVEVADPILEPAPGLARTLDASGHRAPLAVGVVLAALALLALRTRDPAGAGRPTGVVNRPPQELRPAQLRFLQRRRLEDRSVPATIVDLALRGHLRIEEVTDDGPAHWRLVRTVNVDDPLLAFEKQVLRGLFGSGVLEGVAQGAEPPEGAGARPPGHRVLTPAGATRSVAEVEALAGASLAGVLDGAPDVEPGDGFRTAVTLASRGKGRFAECVDRVEHALGRDAADRGLFAYAPAQARQWWHRGAYAVAALGFAGVVANDWIDGREGLVFAAVGLVGLAALPLARLLPRRTREGARLRAEADAFEAFLAADEGSPLPSAARELLFAAYLPYAVAFGCEQRWTRRLASMSGAARDLDLEARHLGAPAGDITALGEQVSRFAKVASTLLSQRPPRERSLGHAGPGGGFFGAGGGGAAGGGGGGGH